MIQFIKRMLERRRARKQKEEEDSLRYMIRILIESNRPTIIVEKGTNNDE